VDPALLDELAANATASATVQLVDGWMLRASPDLPFRRPNCAIALSGAGRLPVDIIEEFYARRSLAPRVQVTNVAPTPVDEELARRGYVVEAPVDILVAESSVVVERMTSASALRIAVTPTLDDAWADTYCALHEGNDRVRAYGRMLREIGPAARAVTATLAGDPVGMAFGVVEREWCGVYGMTTVANARRRGVASTVLQALARAAADLGATRMYLQMERGNDPARALYERAGFALASGYHYRTRE
jgi:GNAT superfamily N-acetyltransferase